MAPLLFLLGLVVYSAAAQTGSLALSSGSAVLPAAVPLSLTFNADPANRPAALQWSLTYPSTVTGINMIAGSALLAAGKSLTCASTTPGAMTCLAVGLDAATIPDGVVGVAMVSTSGAASINVLSTLGASPDASAVPLIGQGGAATVTSPPTAPQNLTAVGGDGRVTLAWTPVNNATSYKVKQSANSGGPYTTVASNVVQSSYVIGGLTGGSTYYFVVSALNGSGESPDSAPISGQPTTPTSTTGLIGYWKMDETSGAVAGDSSGNGNAGLVASPSWVAAKISNGLYFNGSTTEIYVPDSPSLNASTEMTISVWVKADDWMGGNRRIVQRGWEGTNLQYRLLVEYGQLKFDGQCTGCGAATSTLPSTGVWHFIVGTINANGAALYADGQLAATGQGGVLNTQVGELEIGTRNRQGSSGDHFVGTMDELRIYSRILSPDEIMAAAISTPSGPISTAPVINGLSPSTIQAGSPAFLLTVNGSGFTNSSIVLWNGLPLSTTFVNTGQLTAAISASLVTTQNSASLTVITSGMTSNSSILMVTAPPPVITSLNPPAITAGGSSFTLIINGSGFGTSSTVRWNGSATLVSVVTDTQLTLTIPASLIGLPGAATVTVQNSAGVSSGATFTITAPTSGCLTCGLVGYWKMDETSGTVAGDSSGNGNAGPVISPSWVAAKISNGLYFNGSTTEIYVPDSPSLNASTEMTISAWVKADDWLGGNRRIVQRGWEGTNLQYRLLVEYGQLKFDGQCAGCGAMTSTLPSTGVWHFIVGTINASGAALYVDGQLAATGQGGVLNTQVGELEIGTRNRQGSSGDHFVGTMDELRIYNRAISAEEVMLSYQGGS